jgi:erythromycin esterase-like protein
MRIPFLITFSLIAFLVLFCRTTASSQKEIKRYVQGTSRQITTIHIDSSNFDDLEVLGNAIGNARIVALGEQMHGDGTTFEAKGRIIKYLHEKKGFNVLVFESDYFGLTYGFEKVDKTKDSLRRFLYQNLAGMWSWCDKAAPFLYNYIWESQSTKSPLIIAGMDCQLQTPFSFTQLKPKLESALSKIAETQIEKEWSVKVVDNLHSIFFNGQKADPEACQKGKLALESLYSSQKKNQLTSDEKVLVDNVLAAYKNILPYLLKEQSRNFSIRDTQMFENIMWLANEKYPNEKIIIWAHNAHIVKRVDQTNNRADTENMLGHLLGDPQYNPHSYYALGFTSAEATSIWTTRPDYTTIAEEPVKNSFENWLPKHWNYAFIDWTDLNQKMKFPVSFSMKGSLPMSQHRNQSYPWQKAYNGVFFIRKIEGCKTISAF